MDLSGNAVNGVMSRAMVNSSESSILAKRDQLLAADKSEIKAAAQDFEAVFITQMMQQMFVGVEPDENFGGGHAEKIFKSMMLDEYGKSVAKRGGIGIAEQVEKELIKLQEVR